MIKPLTEKEISNLKKGLKYKKWIYPLFIISIAVQLIAGSIRLYAIHKVCQKVSGVTWKLIFEISFCPNIKINYYGGLIDISHWLYISIAYYFGALLMAFFLSLLIQQNRSACLLVELYKEGKSNKNTALNSDSAVAKSE